MAEFVDFLPGVAVEPAGDGFFVRDWPDIPQDACNFYHTMDLPGVGVVQGQWDLRGEIEHYTAGEPLAGRTVLDVGCASGGLSFDMERLGATVVSFDADQAKRIAFIPVQNSDYVTDRTKWIEETNRFLLTLKNSYWFAHKRLESKNVCYYGDVYDLSGAGAFDTVVIGQILVHLRDPITALASAAAVCKDTLIIAEGVYDTSDTAGILHARAAAGGPPYIWWLLSVPAYRELLAMFGFEVVKVQTRPYRCVQHAYVTGEIEITTIVAKRIFQPVPGPV